MEIDKLTLGEIKQLINLFNKSDTNAINPIIGKYCVVRTYSAGVHIGTVESVNGKKVLLKNARRIWKWEGAFTLSEVAKNGVNSNSRISETVDEIYLTEVIELIPATNTAIKKFEACNE